MTVQQQVAERVMNLSDEGAELIGRLLNGLDPVYFNLHGPTQKNTDTFDVAKRFGMGKGIILNTDEFDRYNDEVGKLFWETV